MQINIEPFSARHACAARALVDEMAREERAHIACLPELEAPDLSEFAEKRYAFAAVDGDELLGFLTFWPFREHSFGTTPVRGTFSGIHMHAARARGRYAIYDRLYQTAAARLVEDEVYNHCIALFAHDAEGQRYFYENGFGNRCVDAVQWTDRLIATCDGSAGENAPRGSGTGSSSEALTCEDASRGSGTNYLTDAAASRGSDTGSSSDALTCENASRGSDTNYSADDVAPRGREAILSGGATRDASSDGIASLRYFELPRERRAEIVPLRNGLIAHLGGTPCFMRYPPTTVEREMSRDTRFFVAEANGSLVAFLEVCDEGENYLTVPERMRNICGAYCAPEWRGGTYRSLLGFCARTLRGEGFTRLGVDFESFNPTARGFWLKHFDAYTRSGVRRIDEIAMESYS